jgi:hypothetical protein
MSARALDRDALPPACTWEGCEATGWHEQKAADGKIWARLCETHERQLSAAMESGKAPRILSAWVKAQGRPKKATERM